MKKIGLVIVLLFISFVLVSCKAKPVKISDVVEFEKLFEGAIKYDIRSEEECEEGHIKGFVCMGEKDNDTLIHNIDLVSIDNNQTIILIGNEEQVLLIFEGLSKKGHKNMYYFDGGYESYASLKGEGYVPETGCGC